MITAFGNTVACRPFRTNEITGKGKYFLSAESNNTIEDLQVVYGNDQIPAGSVVWVLAAHKKSAWAMDTNTVTLGKDTLIFVPIADIKLVQTPQLESVSSTR